MSSNGSIFRVTGPLWGESTGHRYPHKVQWRGAWMFCLIGSWTNGWSNNWYAGDLRRDRAYYDVTVMFFGGHVTPQKMADDIVRNPAALQVLTVTPHSPKLGMVKFRVWCITTVSIYPYILYQLEHIPQCKVRGKFSLREPRFPKAFPIFLRTGLILTLFCFHFVSFSHTGMARVI